MNITLRQIRLSAPSRSSVRSRAAERLNLRLAALSLSIRELERELNLKLFDRTTRRVEHDRRRP